MRIAIPVSLAIAIALMTVIIIKGKPEDPIINIVKDIKSFEACVNNKDISNAYQKVSLETEGLLPLFRSVGDICASKFL